MSRTGEGGGKGTGGKKGGRAGASGGRTKSQKLAMKKTIGMAGTKRPKRGTQCPPTPQAAQPLSAAAVTHPPALLLTLHQSTSLPSIRNAETGDLCGAVMASILSRQITLLFRQNKHERNPVPGDCQKAELPFISQSSRALADSSCLFSPPDE